MAFCSLCGEKMEERIVYTPKTHKRKGSEFICPVHGVNKHPVLQIVGRTNPNNHACRDWGKILNNK
ncbi:MAG: hypothetical protein WC332_00635 [Clostridia bacterium]|jgi:hypothetical protein